MPGELIPMMAMMIPITALLIPIVMALTKHQQKMAEILRQGQQQNPHEISQLRNEVAQLRELISHQTILMDDILAKSKPARAESDLHTRLGA